MNLASSTVGLLASIHHLILLNEFVDSKYVIIWYRFSDLDRIDYVKIKDVRGAMQKIWH